MTPPPKSFRPALEPLENRELLASAVLSGGILRITGSDAADSITVRQINSRLSIDGLKISTSAGLVANVSTGSVAKIEVYSYGGNDTIRLNSESVSGQQPIRVNTLINAGAGDDLVYGAAAADLIYAGTGNDRAFGGIGNDTLYADGGNDELDGGEGDDYLHGGDGADKLFGRNGNDILLGNGGNDYLEGNGGLDTFNGGSGFDTYRDDFVASVTVVNGAAASDVIQQQSYTCQTLAALAAHAQTGADIHGQIVYRGSNQFDVKLYRDGASYWERVYFDGTWSDSDAAPSQDSSGRTLPETWVLLFHRARMQQFGLNWRTELTRSQWDAANAKYGYRLYDPADALASFTGRKVTGAYAFQTTPQSLQLALSQKKAVVATTVPAGYIDATSGILGWHCYTITKVYQEGSTWKVQAYNPWGMDGLSSAKDGTNDGYVTLTWDQFTRNFSRVAQA